MKIILQDGRRFVLRFDKDEELLAGLAGFAKQNDIYAATFEGIGTCSTVELGYFNPVIKDYRKKPFLDNLEIVSIAGNISLVDGNHTVHAHGSFANNEFTLLGGHVFKLIVLATCEISLMKLEGALERKSNEDFNLNLLT